MLFQRIKILSGKIKEVFFIFKRSQIKDVIKFKYSQAINTDM